MSKSDKKKLEVEFVTPEAKRVWEAIQKAVAEVETWPEWKRPKG